MTDDLFADPVDQNATPAPEPIHSAEIRCANCMEVHNQCRESAAALVREQIRIDLDMRLPRVEHLFYEMHEGDRVALARWIQGVLERPPLSNTRTRSMEPIRVFLDTMWRDIYELTPDALPIEVGDILIERNHHELDEMRPLEERL
jgi:hypothetical protein